MIVHLTKDERKGHPFTQVDTRSAQDPRLSLKAKGVLLYLLSKPPHWPICAPEIAQAHGCGVDAVRTGLRGLKAAGYLEEVVERNPDGTIKHRYYVLRELSPSTPELPWMPKPPPNLLQPDFPDEDNPDEDNPEGSNILQERKNSEEVRAEECSFVSGEADQEKDTPSMNRTAEEKPETPAADFSTPPPRVCCGNPLACPYDTPPLTCAAAPARCAPDAHRWKHWDTLLWCLECNVHHATCACPYCQAERPQEVAVLPQGDQTQTLAVLEDLHQRRNGHAAPD